jgi:Family of unknown function (DUF6499)
MPPVANWRSATAYDYLNDLDPTEFAWEFLRRNSDYQRDYRTTLRTTGGKAEFPDPLAWRWGLRFPDRSEPASG